MYLILSNINVKNITLKFNKNKGEYIVLYELPYVKFLGLFFKVNLDKYILKTINNNDFIYYIYLNENDKNLFLKIENNFKLFINNFVLLRKYKDEYYIIIKSKNKINKNNIISIKKIKLKDDKYIPIIYLNG